jgi:hypothetical protein
MDDRPQAFVPEEIRLYDRILDFLEDICRWQASPGEATQESTQEVLVLNLTKVANDCRAILLLAQSGFYIQAGILARSTTDACNLMMHIDVERDNAILAERWLEGRKVTHWMLVQSLRDTPFDMDGYRELRRRLDDLVHANYDGLKLYPVQLAGSDNSSDAVQSLTFWKSLMVFYLVTSLLAVQLVAPSLEDQAYDYLCELMQMYGQMLQTSSGTV